MFLREVLFFYFIGNSSFPIKGIWTTKNTHLNYGTSTFDTPNRNFTIGTKAIKIIKSFVAT